MSDMYDDVCAFHERFGHPTATDPAWPSDVVVQFREALLKEEYGELVDAINRRNMPDIAGEAVDLIYVTIGLLVTLGIDLAPFWQAVQAANMAKNPNPLGGKPVKPEGWEAPDLGAILGALRHG